LLNYLINETFILGDEFMRSMFYNYDNNIEKDLEPQPPVHFAPPLKPLTSTPNASFIYTINGKPLGIEVKQGTPINLYFNLQEAHGADIPTVLAESFLKFQLIGCNHKVVFEKILTPEACLYGYSDIKIELSASEIASLRKESYQIRLSIEWPDESYVLYSEADGLFVIR
jgi:hypothetical protein